MVYLEEHLGKMRRYICSSLLLLFASAFPAHAQVNLARTVAENPYVSAVMILIDQWESNQIQLSKAAYREVLRARLEKFPSRNVAATKHPPLERIIPVKLLEAYFDELPELLQPSKKLSAGARLLLAGALVDKTPQLRDVARPDPKELYEKLGASLYLILGAAQLEAEVAKKEQVDATSMQRGWARFLSLGWPFCCADEW